MNATKSRFVIIAIVAMVWLAIGSGVEAFDYNGEVLCQDSLAYLINPTDPSHSCDAGNPRSFTAIVAEAAAKWNIGYFTFYDTGTTGDRGCVTGGNNLCTSNLDGQNVVSMATCQFESPAVLATAWWWYTTTGPDECCIFETDICFNDNLEWWVDDVDSLSCDAAPCYSYDLYSVAVHEFGHWLSLGHEDHMVGGVTQVMNSAFTGRCEFRRDLTGDDVEGVVRAWLLKDQPVAQRCYPVHYHGLGTGVAGQLPAVHNYLADNYPNPFNPSTTIRYAIGQRGHVSLSIYDVSGALVRTLVNEVQSPRTQMFQVEWKGRNDDGRPVSSGVYFYRLQTGEFVQTKKMVLLK